MSGISDLIWLKCKIKCFIKVAIKNVSPVDPSSHLYILRKYVRVIPLLKGIMGLGGKHTETLFTTTETLFSVHHFKTP